MIAALAILVLVAIGLAGSSPFGHYNNDLSGMASVRLYDQEDDALL